MPDDAEMVAGMLVAVGEQSAKDKHWNEDALAFLTGLVLHVKTTAPPELQHLLEVRRLLMLPRGTPEEPGSFELMLDDMMENAAVANLISQKAAALMQKSSEERSGVISGAQSHTHFLDSPRIKRVLSRTTFNLDELKTGAMTLYVVLLARRLGRVRTAAQPESPRASSGPPRRTRSWRGRSSRCSSEWRSTRICRGRWSRR
jgi:type IV secretion system protein VirD4